MRRREFIALLGCFRLDFISAANDIGARVRLAHVQTSIDDSGS